MSITSEELNYLIWRYLQETGHEVSALALQEETRVLDFEKNFKEHIPVGTLVELVQKGILYVESEMLVPPSGEMVPIDENMYQKNFTLVQALEVNPQKFPELSSSGRFALKDDPEVSELTKQETTNTANPESPESANPSKFIKTLSSQLDLKEFCLSRWSPVESDVIAVGKLDSNAKILRVDKSAGEQWTVLESINLLHQSIDGNDDQNNFISNLSWSPDGEFLITGVRSGEMRLWNKKGKLKNILDHHKAPVVAIKWNEDCSHLLTSDVSNITIVWSVFTGTPLQHFNFKSAEDSESLGIDLEWIEQDRFVIPGPAGALLVYAIGNNKPLGRLVGQTSTITSLEFNLSSKLLLSASDDDSIRVWRGGNSTESNNFTGHSKTISSAHWINADLLVSTSYDGLLKVWSVSENGQVGEGTLDQEPIIESTLSPNKKWLAIGTLQGEISIFNIGSFVETFENSSSKHTSDGLSVTIYGEYQVPTEETQVTDISWSQNSEEIAVSYIDGNTIILSL